MIFSHHARKAAAYGPLLRQEDIARLNAYLAGLRLPNGGVRFRPGEYVVISPSPKPNPAQVICPIHVK